MDDNEIKTINEQLLAASRQLEKLNSSTSNTSRSTSILAQTVSAVEQDEKKTKEKLEKVKDSVSKASKGILSYAKTLENSNGSFKPLNSVISLTTKVLSSLAGSLPVVGKALKGVAEGAGEVAKFMVDSFEKSYGMFEKLSGSGVVRTFEDFKTTSDHLSLTFEGTNKFLSTASKDLALFGGSANRGRQMFMQVGAQSVELRDQFQKLGIGATEFNEFQMSYIAQQQIISSGQRKTAKELRDGTERYINEIDMLSKLTGVDRKTIQEQMRARMENASYMATIHGMEENKRGSIERLLTVVGTFGPKMQQGAMEMITAAVNGTIAKGPEAEALRLAMSQVGVDIEKEMKRFVNGATTEIDIINKFTDNSGDAAKKVQSLTQILSDGTVATSLYSEMINAASMKGKITNKIIQEIFENNKKTKDKTDGQNAQLARTRTALTKTQKNIEQMATSSETVTKVMSLMSEGLEEITIKFYEMSKSDMPEHLKARKEELAALKKLRESEKKRDELLNMNVTDPSKPGYLAPGARDQRLRRIERDIQSQQQTATAATRKRETAQQGAGIQTGGGPPPPPPASLQPATGGSTDASGSGAVGSGYGGSPTQPAAATGGGMPQSHEAVSGSDALKNAASSLTSVKSKTGKSAQVNKQFAGQFQKLIDYLDGVGYNIYSLGGYNDRDVTGMKGVKSIHAYGGAIDINPAENPYGSQLITDMPKEIGQIAGQLGLGWGGNWTSVKDAMHFSAAKREGGSLLQAKTGGIFSGPSTGYLAELHGDEMVVPANEGSSKQQFMSDIGGSQLSGATKMLYDEMNDKMDELVRLLDDTVQGQNKILQQAIG